MKNPLIWTTKPGLLANLTAGILVSVPVQVLDTTNNIYTTSYTKIDGSLPTGLTLLPNGTIYGTPTLLSVETTLYYDFIIRARSSNGHVIDGSFTIMLTNIANTNFSWITPEGDLGLVPNNQFYSLQLQTQSSNNSSITYRFLSGELPTGMQISTTGQLIGVPTFLDSVLVDQSQTYRFTVRASTGSTGNVRVNDRSFSISVTNVSGPIIRPTTGPTTLLGTVFDGSQYTQQLTVQQITPNVAIRWSVIEGALPKGISLDTATGLLDGYLEPLELIGEFGPAGYDGTTKLTVGTTAILANSFISGSSLIVGTVSSGTIYLGMYLTGGNVIPGTTIVSSITSWDRGRAYNTGDLVLYLNGYYRAVVDVPANTDWLSSNWSSTSGNANMWTISTPNNITQRVYDKTITATVLNADQRQPFDLGPYDFNQLTQGVNYNFTIQAFDGANYDTQKYLINVVSRGDWTADTVSPINNTFLTADAEGVYLPSFRDSSNILPEARSGSHYAYKLQGYDFQGDDLTYAIANITGTWDADGWDESLITSDMQSQGHVGNASSISSSRTVANNAGAWDFYNKNTAGSTANLPGLQLDSDNGWLYGNVSIQADALKIYKFGVVASKTVGNITYSSSPTFFELPVLGDINNTLIWETLTDLGTIDNGSVSDLSVVARSQLAKDVIYTLVDSPDVSAGLPQGLTLLSSGDISGRVTFDSFKLDNNTTTLDSKKLTIDRTFIFNVTATTSDLTVSSTKEFKVTVKIINDKPYENLYLYALPAIDQRTIFKSIVTNEEIFNPELIYRANDPWFGIQTEIKMLFLAGLNTKSLSDYQTAIRRNHWTKRYNFSDIKTAVVLDNFYKVKYEVVYIQITDPAENIINHGPPSMLNLSSQIANPYIDELGVRHFIMYPNSSENMAANIVSDIGYFDQSSLPPWMLSNQPNTTTSSTFQAPIGYTKAVVLAYTIPGASKLIAYRLKKEGINFNNIEFTVDRYSLDDYYSTNFNLVTQRFNTRNEVTFDRRAKNNQGQIVADVNYAVIVPFADINGRTVDFIKGRNGIDGRTDFYNGQTLIFAKQELFSTLTNYDGWIAYKEAYYGDAIDTAAVEGYDVEVYEAYSIIPGYLEAAQGIAASNQRGGVWRINIINNIVVLTFIQEIYTNQRVRILQGKTRAGAIMYYNPIVPAGQSVPEYVVAKPNLTSIDKPTTFNKNTTKFFSKEDQYYTPNLHDKYLKFPQYGVFK